MSPPNEATEALLSSNKKNEDDKSTERRNPVEQTPTNQIINYNKHEAKKQPHTTQPSVDYNEPPQYQEQNASGQEDEEEHGRDPREFDADQGPPPEDPPQPAEAQAEEQNEEEPEEDEEEMQATDQEIQEGVQADDEDNDQIETERAINPAEKRNAEMQRIL